MIASLRLAKFALMPAGLRAETGHDAAEPSIEGGPGATAKRAAAAAHLLLRLLGSLESDHFDWALEQERYSHRFL